MAEAILVSGLEDWVHLAEVAWLAKSEGGALTKEEGIRMALPTFRELLEKRLSGIGDVSDGGFIEWDLAIDEALERVRAEWEALDRDLWPGDICWLANTAEGNRRAKQILETRGPA
jgi:hypothetical protein